LASDTDPAQEGKMPDPLSSKRHFITTFRRPIGAWLRRATGYEVVSPAPPNKNNPYLLISNHVSVYDVAYALPQLQEMPVIVIHEIFQRNPVLAWLLRPFGLIWKQADLHDGKTIRQMKRAAAAGRSILLYPEGDLTWDGDTGALPDSLVKLVKYIGLPVVLLTEKGAYMTYSRWAGKVRKGLVELHFRPCISKEELSSVDEGTLAGRLRAAFRHSERGWLASKQPPPSYATGFQARDLSKMLFMCPACRKAGSMTNTDTSISCLNCGFSSRIGPLLELDEAAARMTGMKDIWQWHSWQKSETREQVEATLKDGSFMLAADVKKAELIRAIGGIGRIVTKAGFHSRYLKRPEKASAFKATLNPDCLRVTDAIGNERLRIGVDMMLSARVLPMRNYRPNWLLICTKEGYYKLMFEGPTHPAYLWCTALRIMIGQTDAYSQGEAGIGSAAPQASAGPGPDAQNDQGRHL